MTIASYLAAADRLNVAAITILGSGRLGPTASAALGLVGTVVGAAALRRSGDGGNVDGGATDAGGAAAIDRWGATVAVALGSVGLVLGALFLATADGGPGTGNGVVGSVAALALGSLAIVLGALARSRRRGTRSHPGIGLTTGGSTEP